MSNTDITLVDITELSRTLGISVGHCYRLVRSNKIPHMRIGKCYRFDMGLVRKSLIEAMTAGPAPKPLKAPRRAAKPKIKPKAKPEPEVVTTGLWEVFRAAYNDRYKIDPARNARVNSIIKSLVRLAGADAEGLIKFYCNHPDGYYIAKAHDIGLCLRDYQTLLTQMKKNFVVTASKIKDYESKQQYEELRSKFRNKKWE